MAHRHAQRRGRRALWLLVAIIVLVLVILWGRNYAHY
jgi:hypothetical protein